VVETIINKQTITKVEIIIPMLVLEAQDLVVELIQVVAQIKLQELAKVQEDQGMEQDLAKVQDKD